MKLIHGRCEEQLKDIAENSIDAVVTDPPYGLSFMGKKWDYDVPSVDIWREVLRVLKPGGHVLSFGGTRTYHRMVVNIEDAGFEIRDQVQWLYGSGFPKSHNVGNGIGTALKPANEPIVLARKPLIGTVAKNVEMYGTGGLNIDESRIDYASAADLEYLTSHNQNSRRDGNAFTRAGSGTDHSNPKWEVNKQGRWPANVLLDEQAAFMLDEQSGILKNGGQNATSKKGFQDNFVGGKALTTEVNASGFAGDSGGASRFFYVAKASKRERNAGLEGMPEKIRSDADGLKMSDPRMDKPQQRIGNQNHHPTVKPIKLMQYLIKLITPPGGIVLDPFMGSGSTGVAALSLGFDFIGIEMNDEYIEIAKRRIEYGNQTAV